MNHDTYADNYIREILNGVKSIAMVGASPVNVRPSYFAFKYLAQRGYDMIPVNPGHVGKSLLDKPFVGSLHEIGRPVDMIDIFRNSSHIMPVVDEALLLTPLPKVIWMQLGARDDAADRESRGRRHQGRDESLPENRIWAIVLGNLVDGRQFAHAEFKARADADPGHAAFPESDERRRRRNHRIRPRPQKTRTTPLNAIAKRFFHKRDKIKQDCCEQCMLHCVALTANASAAIVPHWEEAVGTVSKYKIVPVPLILPRGHAAAVRGNEAVTEEKYHDRSPSRIFNACGACRRAA